MLLHILKEDAQVGWDAIDTLEVLDVVTGVKLLAQVFAHGLNTDDCLWEAHVRLTCIFEANWAQNFQLFILTLLVKNLLFLIKVNGLLSFTVRDTIKLFKLFLEATQVLSVVPD